MPTRRILLTLPVLTIALTVLAWAAHAVDSSTLQGGAVLRQPPSPQMPSPAIKVLPSQRLNVPAVTMGEQLTKEQFRMLPDGTVIEINGGRITAGEMRAQIRQFELEAQAKMEGTARQAEPKFEAHRAKLIQRYKARLQDAHVKARTEVARLRQVAATSPLTHQGAGRIDRSAPIGTVALGCKLFDCTLKVVGVVPLISRIEPGGPVVVTGINFSNNPGKIRLVGAIPAGWLGAFPGRVLELEINDWGDTFAYGTIPEVTGVFDQEVTVRVVTSDGLAANAPSKSKFKARQEYLALPGAGLRVWSCAPGRYVNDYAYCVGYQDSTYFFGYHRTDHKILNPGDNGIDVLETRILKNGWVFDSMDLIETEKVDGRVDWVDGFRSGSDRATVNIRWSTGRQGTIYYLTRLFIKGPAGIPFID